MIAHLEDRKLGPVLFVILRTFLIAAAQCLGDVCVEPRHRAFEPPANLCERTPCADPDVLDRDRL
jgi:hypothetical protein